MTDAQDDELDPRLGTEVDRYKIVQLLGKGGMGAVYEARHLRLGRRVAIKFLLPELSARSEILRRFENEAMAAGGLEHPNLVAVTDFGRAGGGGAPYLVMEFLEGEDCARLLRRVGALPTARAANIVLQACRGVAAAHEAGIIHRDLKPENLFLSRGGDGGDHVKVLDFGIAKLRPAEGQVSTRTGSTFGTTHYMSPEQARGAADVDARADVWSLGVVLYELIGGRKPFDGEQPLNVVHQILNAKLPELRTLCPSLSSGLAGVVAKALQKDADDRFPTVSAFATALEPHAGAATKVEGAKASAPVTRPSPATTALPAAAPAGRRRRSVGMILALGGVVMGAVAIVLLKTSSPTPGSDVNASRLNAATPSPIGAPAARIVVPTATPASEADAKVVKPVVADVPEPSGHSEPSSPGRARRHAASSHLSPAATPTASVTAPKASYEAAKPVLKLDPNPY